MAFEYGSSEELSRLISKSLILVGFGKYSTKQAKNKSLVEDQLYNSSLDVYEMFTGGSDAEGTFILESDLDKMLVVPDMVVKISEVNKGDFERECDIFLLDASKSNPGYARLRLLKKAHKESLLFELINISLQDVLKKTKEGVFLSSEKFVNFIVYKVNRMGLSVKHFRHGPCMTKEQVNINGYSESQPIFSYEVDTAFGIAFCEWPQEAKSWITRKRPHKWPPQSLVERIRKHRCYVVPVGNPQSEQCALEWRVSYLLSERELVWSFNDTQIHCYILLKFLLKRLLEPIAPDQLSSYHMKTLVFWLSEEKGLSMWYSENLINCLEVCMDKLFDCVKQKTLHHYFNCHVNLFGHKFQNDFQKTQMLDKIHKITTNITPFLIKCLPKKWIRSRFWKLESSETFNISMIRRNTNYNFLETNFMTIKQAREANKLYEFMFGLFLSITCKWKLILYTEDLLHQHLKFKNKKVDGVDSFFIETTKKFMDIRFAIAYFRQKTIHENEAFQMYIDSNSITVEDMTNVISNACTMDEMSGELYLATVYHVLGDYKKSIMIVNALLKKRMYLVYPGHCSKYITIHLRGRGFSKQKPFCKQTNYMGKGRTNPAFDVIFSHGDIYCVPYPLRFECAISEFEKCPILVLVHPCVYVYFLLCYGQFVSKDLTSFRKTLVYLEKAVNETKGGSKRHHALNILSYCYVLDGNLQKAFEYFTESFLLSEKDYVWNAAAIHIAILVMKRLGK